MILNFREIGINLADYNGFCFEKIRPLIINQAADYILEFGGDFDYDVFTHYEWEIDYVQQRVIIPESSFA
jgi:hypothetical protein